MEVFESLLRKSSSRSLLKLEAIPVLSLDESFEDCPEFRDKLSCVYSDIDEYCNGLKKILRTLKQIVDVGKEHSRLMSVLSEDMINLPCRPEAGQTDTHFHQSITRLSSVIRLFGQAMDDMMSDVDTHIYKPVEYSIKNDFEACRVARKAYERSRDFLNSTMEKAYSNPQRKEKMKQESVELKNTMIQNTFNYVYKMIDVEKKKRFEFFDNFSHFVTSYRQHHEKTLKSVHELEPYDLEMNEYCQKEREEWTAYAASAAAKRRSQLPAKAVVQTKRPSKQGYLFKKSRNMSMKDWNRRFFCIRDGHLVYFRNLKEPIPRGSVNLLLSTVKETYNAEMPNCFEVISNENTFSLMAETEEDMREWISAIQSTIGQLLGQLSVGSHIHSSTTCGNDPLSILREASVSNLKCADCGALDPDWVSLNIGCVICIECSGIHRSLGVHISKVRSLTLDRFDRDVLNYLCAIGNEQVNNAWLTNYEPSILPSPQSERSVKEDFIKQKYAQRSFITKPQEPTDHLEQQFYDHASKGDLLECYRLFALGISIQATYATHHDQTLLHAAVICSSLLCADLFLLNDIRTDSYDSEGLAPIHHIVLQNDTDMLRLCLRRGIQYDLVVKGGKNQGKNVLDLVPHHLFQCLRLLGAAYAGSDIDAAFDYDDQIYSPEGNDIPASSPIPIASSTQSDEPSMASSIDSSFTSTSLGSRMEEQNLIAPNQQPSPLMKQPSTQDASANPGTAPNRGWNLSSPRGFTAAIGGRKWTFGGGHGTTAGKEKRPQTLDITTSTDSQPENPELPSPHGSEKADKEGDARPKSVFNTKILQRLGNS
eukprot:TRINITY_DN9125_c0_g1_i1.p1 TRINITY_DN9125_c0_g1~~TRINITY_DN9125_c0_g1_i1.p1  ORF type:complete len:821 (-),score=149.86 TRINITY_DN9125_c0_g1_i1:126-2588(-)